MARALRRDERDVDALVRLDLVEVDREAVGEQQRVARRDAVLDLALPELALELVGEQDHHHVAEAGGLCDVDDLEAGGLGLGDRGRVGTKADDDVDAGVLQVECVSVPLRPKSKDRNGLSIKFCEVCIVVVDHGREGIGRIASDTRISRRFTIADWSTDSLLTSRRQFGLLVWTIWVVAALTLRAARSSKGTMGPSSLAGFFTAGITWLIGASIYAIAAEALVNKVSAMTSRLAPFEALRLA